MKKWLGLVAFIIIAGVAAWWFMYRPAPNEASPSVSNPKPKPELSYVDTVLAKMSLEDKIASLLVMGMDGTDPAVLGKFVSTYKPGGFILMGPNIPSSDTALRAQTEALRGGDAKLPRLVAIDEEGGTVKRLPGDTFASALTLKNQSPAMVAKAFTQRSAMVQSVGVTLNFGIVADATANEKSFIYDRVLGVVPATAAANVAAAVRASRGLTLSTLKHFPGHGETAADSHQTIPTITTSYADWLKRDAPPFAAGIEADADVIMMGHLQYQAVDSRPASLSKKWHDILRGRLGFKGVIITDAMGMLQDSKNPAYADAIKNAVAALQAGNTMLLYVTNPTASPKVLVDGIATAVRRGSLSEQLITTDAELALKLRSKSASLVK